MKKWIIFIVAMLFVVAGVTIASAAPNVGNATQKGSVLIFPKIDISEDPYTDTIVSISNDYYQDLHVKCYWVNKDQQTQDFLMKVTQNHPVWFSARTGLNNFDAIPIEVPPFDGPVGELKCWAVDAAGANQINWNHLYGTAKVIDFYNGTAYEYNSYNFAARSGTLGNPVGTGGNILLDGVQFDACPTYLLFNFNSVGSGWGFFKDTDLTLVPCKQDLRQDRRPTFTKAKFEIWNENETKYTGAYKCIKCWFEDYLSKISAKFTYRHLHTTQGRFRVQGVASTVCSPVAAASPLVGLSAELLDFFTDSLEVENGKVAVAGTTANSAGADPTGFILWDTQPVIIPESASR
jgi:hypothetical protein